MSATAWRINFGGQARDRRRAGTRRQTPVWTRFVAGARALKQAGVDAVTIADCPIARARADSSMLAAKLHRELDIDPIPHMTCRDRNIYATKALLLGLSAETYIMCSSSPATPIPSAERDEVKGVFRSIRRCWQA